jgi:hypothetical protein
LEAEAAVNLAGSINQAIQNFQVKQEQKEQEKIGISAIQSMLGIDDPNLAKAVYKDPAVRDAYQKQTELATKPKGSVVTFERIQQLKNLGYDVDATPLGEGQFLATKISPFAGPSTVVKVGDEGGVAEKLVLQRSKEIDEQYESQIVPVLNTLPNLEAMENLLSIVDEEGGVITGFGADIELALKSLGNRFGADFSDVATTQEYIGLVGNQVAQVITAFGAGTGLSDADREFAKGIAGGQITMDKKALKRLVKIMKDKGKRQIELYNQRVDRAAGVKGIGEQNAQFLLSARIPNEQYTPFFDYKTNLVPQYSPTAEPTPGMPLIDADLQLDMESRGIVLP